MGFFLQLKILLWKNFTLKKRSPWVLVFELFIPLVLFFILTAIRKKQPPQPVSGGHFHASPLPSSGVLAIMQDFCDGGTRDVQGFHIFRNSTAYRFLESFNSIAQHNNFFDPGFSPEEMEHIPQIYKSIIEDPATIHDKFKQAKDFELKALFSQQQSLKDILEKNLSIPTEDVNVVFTSKVNMSEVYRLLTGDSLDTLTSSRTGRLRRSIPDGDVGHNMQSLLDMGNLVKMNQNLKTAKELVQNLANKNTESQNLKKLSETLGDNIPDLPDLSGIMKGLDKTKSSAIPIEDLPSILPHLSNGLLMHVLEDNPQLLLNPEFMSIVKKLLGFQDGLDTLDPEEIADVLKTLFLTSSSLHHMVCDNSHFEKLLIPQDPKDTPKLVKTQGYMCNMTTAQWDFLSKELFKDVNATDIIEKLDLEHMNATVARKRVEKFTSDLKEFILFEKNIIELSKFAANLPQDACEHDIVPTEPPSPETNRTDSDVTTEGFDVTTTESPETKFFKRKGLPDIVKKGKNSKGLLKVWLAMQTTVCGKPKITPDKLKKFASTLNPSDLGLTKKVQYDLGILVHVLYNNPRVLYAPNGTDADLVIQNANQTFALIDLISEYARKWLNVSSEIRDYLMKNETVHNLQSIKEMQQELRQVKGLGSLFNTPEINTFIYNTTVPDRDFFIRQLDIVDNAACSWLSLMEGLSLNVFRGFRTEDELVEYVLKEAYYDNVTVLASVIFTNINEDGTLPPHIVYKMRQNATFTANTKSIRPKYWYPGPGSHGSSYYQFGFVWIQDIIERAMINVHVGRDVVEPGSYVNQMPFPCYKKDQFLFMIEHVMPLCLTISWVYTVAMLVQSIVYEKEQRLKEVMKMMGLNNSVHWLAWFITIFIQMTITMGILTLMLKFGNVLQHSNAAIIFIVLEIFAVATIAFSFLVSVCYSKAKLAAACAGIVYFLSYVPYMYVAIREEAAHDRISAWIKSIASIFSTTAFGLGAKYFAFYEIEGVGVQWDNISISPVEDDQYNLFMVALMMLFDTILYGLLTWYIENVHPGSYGLPKPWYFPFLKSYWCGQPLRTESVQCSWRNCLRRNQGYSLSVTEEDQACAMADEDGVDSESFEPDPDHLPLGVCIDNLTKVYKNGKLAVNKLSLNFYEGQITSFLGHNGAGKTTTMSILTGLFPPTEGYASVYGLDIRTDMEEIRKSLGMCPQHNVLFDKLTVEEHMWFYARLKGVSSADIKEEMETMIQDVGLPKKRNNTVDCLSGGMKRKLSVAIAFVAGSRTVILDEPTAGVDPYARRAIWDLLVKYKEGRTIILSTHHMDEADILGDRIAIISHGQVKCCGSSLYLKSTFGEGYHMSMVKKAAIEEDCRSMASETLSLEENVRASFTTHCQERKVTKFLNKYVSTAYLKYESQRELHYILPFEEARKGGFERLFHNLDKSLDIIQISGYGVMDTTLEEVFLKVTERAETAKKCDEEEEKENKENEKVETFSLSPSHQPTHTRNASLDSHLFENYSLNPSTNGVATDTRNSNERLLDSLQAQHNLRLRTHSRNPSSDSILSDNRAPWKPTHSRNSSTDSILSDKNALFEEPKEKSHRRNDSTDSILSDNRIGLSGGRKKQAHPKRRTHARNASLDISLLSRTGQNTTSFVPCHCRNASIDSHQSRDNNSITSVLLGSEAESRSLLMMGGQLNRAQSESNINDEPLLDMGQYEGRRVGQYIRLESKDKNNRKVNDKPNTLREGKGSYVVQGYCLLLQQFFAIIVKRFVYIRRNWKGLFTQILLPALFVCIAMTVALTAPQISDLPPLVLSPSQYFNLTQPEGNYIPYSNEARGNPEPKWSDDAGPAELIATFRLPSGVGATCVLKSPFNLTFEPGFIKGLNFTNRNFHLLERHFDLDCQSVFTQGVPLRNFVPHPPTASPDGDGNQTEPIHIVPDHHKRARYYPNCHCAEDKSGYICDKGGFQNPPSFKVVTGDILQDISGNNEMIFYLFSTDVYRLHRYGGFSFGDIREFVPKDFGKHAPTVFRKLAVRNVAKVWFNNKGFHSMPTYLNSINNAILRANLPKEKGNPAAYGITLINHPMNNTNSDLSMDTILQGSDVLIAIFIIVAMSFVPASFVLFLVYERSIKAKHLQFVSGINPVVYWLANYFWDMCNYLIPGLCCIIILKIFDIPAYVSSTNLPAVVSLFLLYGWSITPMMYPASFWFEEPSTAYICLIVINLFVGITCIITSFLLEIFGQNDKDLEKIHEALKNVFLMFPNYCLGRGLMDIAFNEYHNEYFFKTGDYDMMKSPFEWKLMSRNLVAMASMGFCFFIITLLCEVNFFIKQKKLPINSLMTPNDEDEDVANERKRVLRGSGRRDPFRLENLTKIYKTRKLGKHLAVDRLCLGVPAGECFGLLGVNGAGKTTTFKMLTGDLPPTGGDAHLLENSILQDMLKVQQNIGYCPQFDALYDELTPREHLKLYARLRGIPITEQSEVVEWALKKLALVDYANRLTGGLSGGNKRKLSAAIALLGHPPVIFMDEPTTGMDPHSRRFLWDLILDMIKGGRSVILTSHSMEECEALCTRLAIMVNGRFKCLGSSQHLKTRFGDGYTAGIRIKGPNFERERQAVMRYMKRHFPTSVLKECHHNMLQFEIRSENLDLSQLFARMEEAQRELNVEDYSVSQNTLDNVFINFVKQQVEIVQEEGLSTDSDTSVLNREMQSLVANTDDVEILDAGGDDIAARIDSDAQLLFTDMEAAGC